MASAQDIAEQAIAKLEQEDAAKPVVEDKKTVDSVKEEVDDKAKADDKSADKKPVKYDKDGNHLKEPDAKIEPPDEEEAAKDAKDGFTADDAVEVDNPKQPDAPTVDATGVQLNAAEQKYIVDNIGQPMVIRGIRGSGDDVKEVELKVFTPGDIPRDFQFQSQADMLQAQSGFARMENKAEQLLGNYRNQASQAATADFDKRENEGIRQDVADLQKDGNFPKFKIQPGQRGFDDDPAAKQMGEVLDIMNKRNTQFLKEYQVGRPYKHIGFKEAYELYAREQPLKKQAKAQKEEDDERLEVADRVGSNRGLTASKIMKPTIHSGITVKDILNKYDSEEW